VIAGSPNKKWWGFRHGPKTLSDNLSAYSIPGWWQRHSSGTASASLHGFSGGIYRLHGHDHFGKVVSFITSNQCACHHDVFVEMF